MTDIEPQQNKLSIYWQWSIDVDLNLGLLMFVAHFIFSAFHYMTVLVVPERSETCQILLERKTSLVFWYHKTAECEMFRCCVWEI